MESKELRQLVLEKVAVRKRELEEIKVIVESFSLAVLADVQAAGAEIKTVEELGDILIEAADDATSSGLLEPFDGPAARVMLGKLLKTKWGLKVESWYQGIRSKILK